MLHRAQLHRTLLLLLHLVRTALMHLFFFRVWFGASCPNHRWPTTNSVELNNQLTLGWL